MSLHLQHITITPFCYRFTFPLTIGGQRQTHRRGMFLSLTDNHGCSGQGEIAPLPGLDRVSLADCRAELQRLVGELDQMPLRPEQFDLYAPGLGILAKPAGMFNRLVMFGLESALLNLLVSGKRIPELQSLSDACSVNVNGLFVPSENQKVAEAQWEQLKQAGFQTIKIKIGRLDAAFEIKQILQLYKQGGAGLTFRLDGNQSLTIPQYHTYYDRLKGLPVEYVEEPLNTVDQTPATDIPWPLALDELLNHYLDPRHPDLTSLPPWTAALILKPGLLHGLHGLHRLIRDALALDIKPVLSSSFNSPLTIHLMGTLIRLLKIPNSIAHGLNTLKFLVPE